MLYQITWCWGLSLQVYISVMEKGPEESFLILRMRRFTIGMSCKQFMEQRHIILSAVATNNSTWLWTCLFFCHYKIGIQLKIIWHFFIAFSSQLMKNWYEGSVCRNSHQKAPVLAQDCSSGYHWPKFCRQLCGYVDMLDYSAEGGNPFYNLIFKEPNYVKKIMDLCITIDNMEWVNTKHNYKVRDVESLVNISYIRSNLDCTFTTTIR